MRVGESVVCIRDAGNPFGSRIFKGRIYLIHDTQECCCGHITIDVGVRNDRGLQLCLGCGHESPNSSIVWCGPGNFRPIEYNSATEELANKEIVKETSDIPIKEPAL